MNVFLPGTFDTKGTEFAPPLKKFYLKKTEARLLKLLPMD